MKNFITTKQDEGRTLLKFLMKMLPDVPGSRIEKLFRKKDIKIDGKRSVKKTDIIKEGQEIIVYGIESKGIEEAKYAKPNFEVIFEDENILVVDKPVGVSIHSEKKCLDYQVLSYLNWENTNSFTPSHVGRIDKVTSGLVIYGKTYEALRQLKENQGDFEKVYRFKSDLDQDLETEYLIGHDERKQRMCIHPKGNLTKTKFWIDDKNKKYAQIFTGRKHQIRVSLAKLGFPIYGDVKYGGRQETRVYLHAFSATIKGMSGNLEYLNDRKFVCKITW
ncbi:RluA family pseudouridine synthase [Mycoplasma marinum]|uniref:RNA pseudouridylate synthase n=1 Tax=Mycoplasma marinum TaxID=1937190 RepID=A0A4V2NHZ0_9MOLU|nr:RluA family pseudouridine synthase [Mycoplasma marinum]TCG10758.1 RluA family pseudouridine synthase [Mycoplasma marinum]